MFKFTRDIGVLGGISLVFLEYFSGVLGGISVSLEGSQEKYKYAFERFTPGPTVTDFLTSILGL